MIFPPARPANRIWLVATLVLFGITCRVAQYAANPSLWHDEALVALNVIDRPAPSLLGRLDYAQAAPPLFLWIERALWILTHNPDLALRSPSLICGILATALFAVLCVRVLPASAAPWAVAIFVFSDKLIWHSAEVKPYSGDALAAVFLLFLAERVVGQGGWKRLACVAALLVWFSYPSVFVFGGISLALLSGFIRERKTTVAWILGNLLVVVSFAALYLITIRHQHVDYLATFWAKEFPDYARPWSLPVWLLKQVYRFADYPYRELGSAVLVLAVLGAIAVIQNRSSTVGRAVLWTLGLAILAALGRRYPFTGDRITVYLLPGLFLLCGAGIAWLADRLPGKARLLAIVPAVVLVGRGVVEASYRLAVPRSRSEIRDVVNYVRAHRQAGEALYLVHESEDAAADYTGHLGLEFLCYWRDPDPPLHAGMPADLSNIGEHRFWVISSALPKHGTARTMPLLIRLNAFAIEREQYLAPHGGGCAVLFEKRNP